jgi:Ca-activated chloride channel homolog
MVINCQFFRLTSNLLFAALLTALGGSIGCSPLGGVAHSDMQAYGSAYDGDEAYFNHGTNPIVSTDEENKSTFGIDVDTGSYTLMRRDVNRGSLPHKDGVRVEEYLNYFTYEYPQPQDEHPFAVHLESVPSYFGDDFQLLKIGLQGRILSEAERGPANLVFLIDVSGSMQSAGKLDLIKASIGVLVENLNADDMVSIVTYAGKVGVALDATPGDQNDTIMNAINDLTAGGSTNGEAAFA